MGAAIALLRILIPATIVVYIAFRLYQRLLEWQEGAAPERRKAFRGPQVISFKRSPWKVLGLEEGASEFEVEAAWRRLRAENDPARLVDAGPEVREFARQRMEEIAQAYDELRAMRGEGGEGGEE